MEEKIIENIKTLIDSAEELIVAIQEHRKGDAAKALAWLNANHWTVCHDYARLIEGNSE